MPQQSMMNNQMNQFGGMPTQQMQGSYIPSQPMQGTPGIYSAMNSISIAEPKDEKKPSFLQPQKKDAFDFVNLK